MDAVLVGVGETEGRCEFGEPIYGFEGERVLCPRGGITLLPKAACWEYSPKKQTGERAKSGQSLALLAPNTVIRGAQDPWQIAASNTKELMTSILQIISIYA